MASIPVATRRLMLALLAAALVAVLAAPTPGSAQAEDPTYLLFSGEGNRLNVYDVSDLSAGEFPKQTLIKSGNEGDVDFNAQICFDPENPTHFIGGEDTEQPDPPAGWGYFELGGTQVGELTWDQQGRFTPTYQPTFASVPENYGCFFRDDNTMFTTDIGDQYPGFAGNGQLILWFPPFEGAGVLGVEGPFGPSEIEYCKIAIDIPTAGGIWLDEQDRLYVASNRPGVGVQDPQGLLEAILEDPTILVDMVSDLANGDLFGAVYRYSGDWPTSGDAAGGCGRTDGTDAPLVDEGRVTREVFIGPDQLLPAQAFTPSAIWPSGNDTFYLSSVFTGVIAEYDLDGMYLRTIMSPPPGETFPYPTTGTPYGIVVDDRGNIFYADLGVTLGPPPGPAENAGSVRFITFDENNEPSDPVIIEDGLPFPDGVGVIRFDAEEPDPDPEPKPMPTTGGGLVLGAALAVATMGLRRRRRP